MPSEAMNEDVLKQARFLAFDVSTPCIEHSDEDGDILHQLDDY